jgi:small subunit ribosomal protein S6
MIVKEIMNEEKQIKTSHYEMLYIISNQFTEEEVKPIVEKVASLIANNGGVVTYSEVWGKKKMTYPIKNFGYGYYFLVEFDVDVEKLRKIDKVLRMSNEVLRHQIIAKAKRSAEEIKAEKEKTEKKMVDKKIAEEKAEEQKEEETKKESKKLDLKDLDEKLDKILDTDDLL